MKTSEAAFDSWRRRLRRRFHIPIAMYAIAGLMTLAVYICILLWLSPGRQHSPFALATRALWGFSELFQVAMLVLFMALGLWLFFLRSSERIVRVRLVLSGVSFVGKMAAIVFLIWGRIDLAVYCAYLPTALLSLSEALVAGYVWQLCGLFPNVLLIYAVQTHSFRLAVVAIISSLAVSLFVKPGLRSAMKRKPSAAKYLQQKREDYRRYRSVTTLSLSATLSRTYYLEALCDLGIWEEATAEVRRLGKHFAEKPFWMMRIALGQGRFADAKAIAEAATQNADANAISSSASQTPKLQALLALTYAKMGEKAQALALVEKLASNHTFTVQHTIAACLSLFGEYDRALQRYEQVTYYGNNPRWLLGVARNLNALGSDREAAYFYRASLLKTPFLDTVQLQELAGCYRRLRKIRLAHQAEAIAASVPHDAT